MSWYRSSMFFVVFLFVGMSAPAICRSDEDPESAQDARALADAVTGTGSSDDKGENFYICYYIVDCTVEGTACSHDVCGTGNTPGSASSEAAFNAQELIDAECDAGSADSNFDRCETGAIPFHSSTYIYVAHCSGIAKDGTRIRVSKMAVNRNEALQLARTRLRSLASRHCGIIPGTMRCRTERSRFSATCLVRCRQAGSITDITVEGRGLTGKEATTAAEDAAAVEIIACEARGGVASIIYCTRPRPVLSLK